jgi:glyceraldehyde 3-phosphate dehydrogenase
MAKKIGINGFGRVGRILFRNALNNPNLEIVGINDLTDTKTVATLLKYDSTFRTFNGTVKATENSLIVNDIEIPYTAVKEPEKIPWADYNTEIVYESTGVFTKRDDAAKHLEQAGVRVVLVSAPSDDADATLVYGVNNDAYQEGTHTVVSAASCTTNGLAPIAKVLNDNFGIKRGLMTTDHAYTNDQRVLDFPHKDLRRARTAATNIIPTTTGAAKAIGLVIPELKGKLDGIAMRVPVIDGSIIDLTVETEQPVTKEQINAVMKEASEGFLQDVLGYTEDPIVSSDIIGITYGSLFDASLTMVINENFVKVFSWYDNENGFCSQCIRLLDKLL